ncbi:proton myo-inositol cotransporter-like [Cololabis saira]|uniref:proton myo-inositol cotransporter-like n=1 Tax=Cololabis saira TaxID=129043 RepID=UPI002AD2E737|nr:proton myo-inositol cotransporter-like [Cololabis saira]XP_061576881.1 proton myo-inositol cotransporter-like [Cololabis saira]XP_061578419.1 proton myo-inositol cotransporter-like [Cololabis saira]
MGDPMAGRRQSAGDDGERGLIVPPPRGDPDRDPPPSPAFIYVLAFFSALGGFLFGYDTGVVSGAMLLLKRELNLSALWQELLVSSTVGAAALSALAGGYLNGRLGRRRCILGASLVFAVGGVLLGAAPNRGVLLLGRVTVGLGIGIASMTVPVYMAEVSPPQRRGQLVTLNSLFITGGQFIASVVDGAFSYMSRDGWRFMLGLSVLPALLQFCGFLFLPESPRWLLQKGRGQEARRVLVRIRGDPDVEDEFQAIRAGVEEEQKGGAAGGPGGVVILRMLAHGPTRRALAVGCGLQMFQQLSGINTVMYYSATILQMAGVRDDKEAIWLAAATSATNFLFTLVGFWLVERVGRRKLTLGSLLGTGLSLALLAVGFLLSAQNSPLVTLDPVDQNSTCSLRRSCERCMLDPGCGFCYRDNGTSVFESSCVPVSRETSDHAAWGRCSNVTEAAGSPIWAYNFCPTSYSWVVLVGLILYLAFFAPGMGPMPWTVNSEIYPLWARSTGNACSAGVNWTFNVLVSLTFLHVAEYLTYYGAFFLYTGLVVLGLLFVLGCLPETQGRQLEDIENLFTGPLCSCGGPDPDDRRHVHYIRVKGSNYLHSDNEASDVD